VTINLPVLTNGLNGVAVEPPLSDGEREALQREVRALARERQAVILAHNYQVPEVQDVADFVGDSLGLAREASRTDAQVIAMCGVYFMAETAKILNPDKIVLMPDPTAGCSLADSITAEDVRRWKAEHPGAVVVSYVNTTAAVKAESDYCVTSGNAEAVVRSIPSWQKILFLPDFFLGSWLKQTLGRDNMEIWLGECHVHAGIRPDELEGSRKAHSDADLLVHPECGCSSQYVYGKQAGMLSAASARSRRMVACIALATRASDGVSASAYPAPVVCASAAGAVAIRHAERSERTLIMLVSINVTLESG